MTAQALVESAGDPDLFRRALARRLRLWLLSLPAGIGFGTLRALLKLNLGFSVERSGVYSAGNGPCMRSAIIGLAVGDDNARLRTLVRINTVITHTDPKAFYGSLAIAAAARMAARRQVIDPDAYLTELSAVLEGEDAQAMMHLLKQVKLSIENGEDTEAFADSLGQHRGIGGYVYHTVPVVIHAWLRYPDRMDQALPAIIDLGGDTDTTASILGSIVGAGGGKQGIPSIWLRGLCEWPRTMVWMEKLADILAHVVSTGQPEKAPSLPAPTVALRNMLFTTMVLAHGLRRLLPPW